VAIDEHVHRFSTEEYDRIVETGAFDDLRVELLDGLLVDMSPQGGEHARLIQAFTVLLAPRADLLHVQLALSLEDGWVPEPDLALAERPGGRHPTTALVVVEIAVSSRSIDLRKAAVYARARIPRYWLVDVPNARVLEHTEPLDGRYEVVTVLAGDDVLDASVDGVPPTTVAAMLSR
jgi:Uma2 family endonuclease